MRAHCSNARRGFDVRMRMQGSHDAQTTWAETPLCRPAVGHQHPSAVPRHCCCGDTTSLRVQGARVSSLCFTCLSCFLISVARSHLSRRSEKKAHLETSLAYILGFAPRGTPGERSARRMGKSSCQHTTNCVGLSRDRECSTAPIKCLSKHPKAVD